ncbi:LOW QUALITY PROTEIN: hypothetical protein U0070_015959, partial [Myodes glareolus]
MLFQCKENLEDLFIFGLLYQLEQEKLEAFFGYYLSQEVKENCTPQVLKENNMSFLCDNHMFFESLTQNCKLQHLNLRLTFLSRNNMKLLCNALCQEECNLEKLVAASFPLITVRSLLYLTSSKTLKHLNVSSINLDKGMYSLCKALCHPDCSLKHAVLSKCSLSEQCWDYLSDVLNHYVGGIVSTPLATPKTWLKSSAETKSWEVSRFPTIREKTLVSKLLALENSVSSTEFKTEIQVQSIMMV